MEEVRQYLLSVTAAAILCGIVTGIIGKKSAYGAIIKLLTGLFLAVTVIAPWAKMQLIDFSEYADGLSDKANLVVSGGEAMASEATAAIIKSQTEAYILDKAASMGLDIEVEVTLSSSDPPLPCAVSVKGSVSPFSKEKLSGYIANDLGIPGENQLWT